MRVPQEDHIHSQTFNSKKLEFVWRFDNRQVILSVSKDKSVYLESGRVDENGDYVGINPDNVIVGKHTDLIPSIILHAVIWTDNNNHYNFFSNGKDLVPLIEDVIEYLK